MALPTCAACGASGPLFRANPKGEKAVWACRKHLKSPPSPEVERLVDALAPPTDADGRRTT